MPVYHGVQCRNVHIQHRLPALHHLHVSHSAHDGGLVPTPVQTSHIFYCIFYISKYEHFLMKTILIFLFAGWPFAALIGLPIAIDIVFFKRQFQLFINWCVISAVTILTPQLICDTYYYGKPVLASLNIVLYNVFTSHGPDLYGTEPAQFYLINGFLNFNFIFLLALAVVPFLTVTKYILKGEVSSNISGLYLLNFINII